MIDMALSLTGNFSLLLIGVLVEYARWRSRRTGMWADKWPCRPRRYSS